MPVFYEKGKKYNCRVKGIPYYRTSVTINGKQKQVYGDGEKDARRRVATMKEEAAQGFDIDRKNEKVRKVFEYWLYDIKRVDSKVKASSFERYDCIYRTNIKPYDILEYKMCALDSIRMQSYATSLYEDHGVSTAGVENTIRLFKSFTRWAVDEGYIIKDPCRRISIPGKYQKIKKPIETFTAEERQRILQYMNESDYIYSVLIRLAFATGMRQGELIALKWSDIKDGVIHVQRSTRFVTHIDKDMKRQRTREIWEPKTANAVRDIPLLPETQEMLAKHKSLQRQYFSRLHLGKQEYVFTNTAGGLVDPSILIQSYRCMLRNAGVPPRKFHAIRHTFATEAIRHGVDVKDLQLLMGHGDIQTTYLYVQASPKSKRNAIELMGVMM